MSLILMPFNVFPVYCIASVFYSRTNCSYRTTEAAVAAPNLQDECLAKLLFNDNSNKLYFVKQAYIGFYLSARRKLLLLSCSPGSCDRTDQHS